MAVGGAILVVVGVLLTLGGVGGNVLPTVLAVAGVGAILAGVITGAMLVAENARYHQSQSFYDDE